LTTEKTYTDEIPIDYLPLLTWPHFFYKQQIEFSQSDKKEVWFIGGNGTGKTLIFYWNLLAHMLGFHPKQLDSTPIKVRVLVPSFDNVEKVALDKIMQSQRIVFKPPLLDMHKEWLKVLEEHNALLGFHEDKSEGYFEIGPMLPKSQILPGKDFKKEHRGLELINGSSIWWVTTEQGWMSMRGAEQDIEGVDEESGYDEFNQVQRGLRNAKGGGRVYGALTPPYKEGQGPTWTKERVINASLEDLNIHVINACMADNPAITPAYIEWFSRGKSKERIAVEVFGKYPSWGDLVHPDFQDRLWNSQKCDGHLLPNDSPMPDINDVDWVMAFDWHQSKACAAVWGWVQRDGNIVIFDELDKDLANGKQIDELADLFRSIEGYPFYNRRFRRWQDPSAKHTYTAVQRGFNAWDAFRKVGIVTSAGQNREAKEVGIPIVNQYFKGNGKDHPRIFIFERCRYLRQYLNNHYWKRGEDGIGKPDPKWSDYPICVRYILQDVGWKKYKNPNKKQNKWPIRSYEVPNKEKRMVINFGGMI
jgi:hypothetical protein